jgi:hypothetical protein
MSEETSTPEVEEVVDRKDAIEAAFEQHSAPEVEKEAPAAEPAAETPTKEEPLVEPKPTDEKSAEATPAETDVAQPDKAPQSWKPAARAKWDALDPEVRQEVARRERQTTQVLNESAGARQLQDQFVQAVQPFMGRLQSLNAHPIAAVQELLKVDYFLATAPKNARAQRMAQFIKDYDIDIEALDAALSGRITKDNDPAVKNDEVVDRLLQERLAPYQRLLQREQQREQEETQALAGTIEAMASDPEKYPYFDKVRFDMADIIDLSIKKGRPETIESAYNKAVQLDPVISQELARKSAAEAATKAAALATSQAQRARRASVSVGGAPTGNILGSPAASDRRAVIAAAFEDAGR